MQMLTLKLRTRKLNYPELLSPCLNVIKYLNGKKKIHSPRINELIKECTRDLSVTRITEREAQQSVVNVIYKEIIDFRPFVPLHDIFIFSFLQTFLQ
jgi:hypothetical protein